MADRRDFMGYIGTGAIGSIVGYYVGAQKLLGIQPEETARNTNPEQLPEPSTEQPTEQPAEQPTEEPTEQPTEQPTEEPTEQPTEQPDDLRVFDDFEDSELGWTVTDGQESTITFSTDSIRGSQSLYFQDGAEDTHIQRGFDTQRQVTRLNFWFKYTSNSDNNFRVILSNTTGDTLIEIREFGQTVHYKNTNQGGVSAEPIASISQNAWYKVSLSSVDYNSNTLDISVMDASEEIVNSVTEVDFWNPSEATDTIRIVNSLQVVQGPGARTDPLWIDDITYNTSV